jgi:hypothetical protein
MKTYFYATTVDIFVGYYTTKLFAWGLAFSRCNARKNIFFSNADVAK